MSQKTADECGYFILAYRGHDETVVSVAQFRPIKAFIASEEGKPIALP